MDKISFQFYIGNINIRRIDGGPLTICNGKFWSPVINGNDINRYVIYETSNMYKIVFAYQYFDIASFYNIQGDAVYNSDGSELAYKDLPETKYQCINLLKQGGRLGG